MSKGILVITFVALFFTINTVSADEEVPNTEELLQELYAGKNMGM